MAPTEYGSINEDDDITEYVQESNIRHILTGFFLALLCGGLFTANNFIINQYEVNAGDLLLVRTILQLTIYISICFYRNEELLPGSSQQRIIIIFQGLASSLTFTTALSSVTYMEVPDALCIVFACPVVTIILSAIFLGDTLTASKIIAGFQLFIGVILVCKPPFLFGSSNNPAPKEHHSYYVGVLLAVTACLSGGSMNVMVSRLKHVSSNILVLWSAVSGILMSVIYCLSEGTSSILSYKIYETTWIQWTTFIGLSLSGLIAFTTLTLSLQLISPNIVASLRCLELVLAFSVESIITGSMPDIVTSTGGALIILGVIILSLQDYLAKYTKEMIMWIVQSRRSSVSDFENQYTSLIHEQDQ